MTATIWDIPGLANPYLDIIGTGMPRLRYRGVAHDGTAAARRAGGSGVTMSYRGVRHISWASRRRRLCEHAGDLSVPERNTAD